MTRTTHILLWTSVLTAGAQQPLVLIDPARGGADAGARVADGVPEKQVTLDLAGRLASLLRARGFMVTMTREADVDVASDARAALANNTHPLACILLYAVPGGGGVHLYTSALRGQAAAEGTAVRWDEAQAAYADRSRTLAAELRSSMEHARVTASAGQTWMRPLDNMECPAVAVEVAPEKSGTGTNSSTYQGHIANSIANTLLQWRAKMQPPTQPATATPAVKPATAPSLPSQATPPATATPPAPSGAPAQAPPPAKPKPKAPPPDISAAPAATPERAEP